MMLEHFSQQEHAKALAAADQVERELMEIMSGQRKIGKLDIEPITRIVQFVRTGSTLNATLRNQQHGSNEASPTTNG